MRPRHVAILGAGIMGCSAALFLARRGHRVSLFDKADAPFSGASRWNEGKIHLGFLYSADPSLKSAREVLPGGLLFAPLLEELTGLLPRSVMTSEDDLYLCHSQSVVAPDAMLDYAQRVAQLVRQHPDAMRYLVDVTDCRVEELTAKELARLSGSPEIVAGLRVPERSVSTTWVADGFLSAVAAEPNIQQHMNWRVTGVRAVDPGNTAGAWRVDGNDEVSPPFDCVINALWEGKIAVDRSAGIEPDGDWSHRYRLSLFLRTREEVEAPSAVIAAGPFGDVKNYNKRDFYLSWYPAGLMLDSREVSPPDPPPLDEAGERERSDRVLESLIPYLPAVEQIAQQAQYSQLRGGWVFAAGSGKLSDPKSTLHRRADFGISRLGSYLTVDTGKYSIAPWLAKKLVPVVEAI